MNKQELQSLLETKRTELTSGAARREEISVERVPDAMDDVQHTANRELVIASLNRHWRTVRAIDSALARINDGSFGECAECGEAISDRRLRAIPWAHLCLSCQEREDAAQTIAA